jgi:hypothetical protein
MHKLVKWTDISDKTLETDAVSIQGNVLHSMKSNKQATLLLHSDQ